LSLIWARPAGFAIPAGAKTTRLENLSQVRAIGLSLPIPPGRIGGFGLARPNIHKLALHLAFALPHPRCFGKRKAKA
jgi:hypothetical protein